MMIMYDNVSKPKHYNTSDLQPITAIEAWKLNFHLGNVVKYVARAGKKIENDLLEDLEKAKWYLDREIKRVAEERENLKNQ